MVENLPANTGDVKDAGSIPGLGVSPGVGNDNHSRILAWKILGAEEHSGLHWVTKSWTRLSTHTQTRIFNRHTRVLAPYP